MNSYTVLNQKLFGIKIFEDPADLDSFEPYFYDERKEPVYATLPMPMPMPISEKQIAPVKVETERRQLWFEPKQSDTLFWCVYASVFGVSDYMMIGNKYANKEWDEKQKMVLEYTRSPKLLRDTNHKITLGNIQEMLSEYMTSQTSITSLGLIGLSVFYKVKIMVIDSKKKTHLLFEPAIFDTTCIIYKHDNMRDKYKLYMGEDHTETTFCLESFKRPLRAISSYKINELEDIAGKVLPDMVKIRHKKAEIYQKLTEHCSWV